MVTDHHKGETSDKGLNEWLPILRVVLVDSCRQLPYSNLYYFGIGVKYKEPFY